MKKIMLSLFLFVVSLFADSLSDIRQNGVVRIGIMTNQPPFSSLGEMKHEGFEVELARVLGSKILGKKGGKVELAIVERSSDRLPLLLKNRVDVLIASVTVTDERAKLIDFSDPYLAVNISVLTNKRDNIKSFDELKNKTIIVENETTAEKIFRESGFNVALAQTAVDGYRMLKAGKGQAYANDNVVVLAFPVIDRSVEVNVKNLSTPEYLAVGVKKGEKNLLNLINKELKNLNKDGFFDDAFDDFLAPYYKGTVDKEHFLLDNTFSK